MKSLRVLVPVTVLGFLFGELEWGLPLFLLSTFWISANVFAYTCKSKVVKGYFIQDEGYVQDIPNLMVYFLIPVFLAYAIFWGYILYLEFIPSVSYEIHLIGVFLSVVVMEFGILRGWEKAGKVEWVGNAMTANAKLLKLPKNALEMILIASIIFFLAVCYFGIPIAETIYHKIFFVISPIILVWVYALFRARDAVYE